MDKEQILEEIILYCLKDERTEVEVRRRLSREGLPLEEIETLLAQLKERGYLDDKRYARLYIESKQRTKSWGYWRLKSELIRKGIDESIVLEALEDVIEEEDTTSILKGLLERKLNTLPQDLPWRKKRERLVNYAAYRGHSYDDINELLDELLQEDF